jgi:hypothetical protein
MRLRLALTALILVSCTACEEPRTAAEERLRKLGPEQLRRDAALLYKDLFARPSGNILAVKESQWPKSFTSFAPQHVAAFSDGFTMALVVDGADEAGLYIVPST